MLIRRKRGLATAAALATMMLSSLGVAQDRSFCVSDDFTDTEANGDKVFDLEISLYGTAPAGSSDRASYEEVFTHFARGVYEASNGAHYIRNLTIYQGGAQKRFADIIWGRGNTDAEWRASGSYLNASSFRGGIAHSFAKTWMYDHAQDNHDPDNPFLLDMVRENAQYRERIGHIVAHEFAHFAYALFDEYNRNPQNPQVHTMMGNQSLALLDPTFYDFPYLNFSTELTPEWTTASNDQRNYWGVSSWEFLAADCANRPPYETDSGRSSIYGDDGESSPFQHQQRHVYFPELTDAQPLVTDTWTHPTTGDSYEKVRTELDTAGGEPTKYLTFTWSDAKVEMELVLDVSGSMEGQPIVNVRAAGTQFVDEVVLGRTTLGVTTFESTVMDRFALTEMNTTADQDQIKQSIGLITTGDNTAMYDGVKHGLQKLADRRQGTGTSARQIMFLLSDGNDNASTATEGEIINLAREAGVRVNTVGYADRDGSQDYWTTLQTIAYGTGGQFFYGLTDPANIGDAMRIAFGDALDVQDIELYNEGCLGELFDLDPDCRANVGFAYAVLAFEVDYVPGNDGDPAFDVVAPDGTVVASDTIVRQRADGSRTTSLVVDDATIAAHGAGQWRLRRLFTNNDATFLGKRVMATPGDGDVPIEVALSSRRNNYRYPQPIQIDASVMLDTTIAGLEVTAEFVTSSGTVGVIELVDDGTGSDDRANDGVYGGQFADYAVNGTYDVNVVVRSNGQAMRVILPHDIEEEPALEPLGFEFSRRQTLKIGVFGVVADDHGDDLDNATVIFPDYRSHAGKIEQTGDVDFFRIEQIDVSSGVAVRLYEPDFGIAPEITVYSSSGDPIAYGNGLSALSVGGYISVEVPQDLIEPTLYFSVSDMNGNSGGTYAVDAGPTTSVDERLPALVAVTSRDVRASENNISGIEFQIQNNSARDISNFKVLYYFETEHFESPVLEDWWSEFSDVSLVQRGSEQYAVEFDYAGFTLPAGEGFPLENENSVGLHYAGWAPWDTSNDHSNIESQTFESNPNIAVFNEFGHLIYGRVPPVHAAREPVVNVTAFSREDKLFDPAWTGPDIYIQNDGDPISDFKVYYYFTADNGKQPQLAVWDALNASVTLQHLGGADYRIEYDYSGFTLMHSWDIPWPSRTLVGAHYPDWSPMDLSNDASNNTSAVYAPNANIEVQDSAGNVIYGTF